MYIHTLLITSVVLMGASVAEIRFTMRYGCEMHPYPTSAIFGCTGVQDTFCSSNKYCVAIRCQNPAAFPTLGVEPGPHQFPRDPNREDCTASPEWWWHIYAVSSTQAEKTACLCDGAVRFRFFEISYADYLSANSYCNNVCSMKFVDAAGVQAISTPVPAWLDNSRPPGALLYQNNGVGMFKVIGAPGAASDQFAFMLADVTDARGITYHVNNSKPAALVPMDELYSLINQQVGLPKQCSEAKTHTIEWSSVGRCSKGMYTLMQLDTNSTANYTMLGGTYLVMTPPASQLPLGSSCTSGSTPCQSVWLFQWPGYCYFGKCWPLMFGAPCNFNDECSSNYCSPSKTCG